MGPVKKQFTMYVRTDARMIWCKNATQILAPSMGNSVYLQFTEYWSPNHHHLGHCYVCLAYIASKASESYVYFALLVPCFAYVSWPCSSQQILCSNKGDITTVSHPKQKLLGASPQPTHRINDTTARTEDLPVQKKQEKRENTVIQLNDHEEDATTTRQQDYRRGKRWLESNSLSNWTIVDEGPA